jgi:predicted transcriptional regulator of viral defense system
MENAHAPILDMARRQGLLRPRDVEACGFSRMALSTLARQGQLTRLCRGLYALPDRSVSEHAALAEVVSKHPNVVVCLLSALQFHGLTTQSPFEVWVAIANKARAPKMDYPPLRIVRFSGDALTEGVEEHQVDGFTVRVTSVAKTVADCFKYRNKIGLDVALEALRESWNAKRVKMDDLWTCAQVCRVANVMRPYLETLT